MKSKEECVIHEICDTDSETLIIIRKRGEPVIISLEKDDNGQFQMTCNFNVFKPLGMMVTGHDENSYIVSIMIGNQRHLYGSEKVPASYFDIGESFESLERRVKHGELTPERVSFTSDVAYAGLTIRVKTIGVIGTVTMWGRAF